MYVAFIGLVSIGFSAVPSGAVKGVMTSQTPAGTILWKKPNEMSKMRWFDISVAKHLHQFTVWRECQSPKECLQCIIVEQSHLFIVQRRRLVHWINRFSYSTNCFQCISVVYTEISIGGQCEQVFIFRVPRNALHKTFVITQISFTLAFCDIPYDGRVVNRSG